MSTVTGWSERAYPCATADVLLHRIQRLVQRRYQLLRQTGEVLWLQPTVLGARGRGGIHVLISHVTS